jgi:hypothetical protein
MTKFILVAALAVAAMFGGPTLSLAQPRGETSTILQKLEQVSHQSYLLPDSLAALVKLSQAAVVGRIVDFGDLTFSEDTGSRGQVIGLDAFASYRVAISEVLFNRRNADGPVLAVGQTTVITQAVGGKEAKAFANGELPVMRDDECLMFLWHRPGSDSWSVLQWPLQFRHSTRAKGGAETVSLLPDKRNFMTPERLGSLVPVIDQPDGRVIAQWSALLAEVKRLAVPVGPR